MNKTVKYAIPLAAFAAGLVIAGSVAVQAATINTGSGSGNPMSNLVSAIAQKFNLNQNDVQQVFDDQHKQMEAQHAQMYADSLTKAVADGRLTQDQADKLIAKQKELESQREANKADFQNKTESERQAEMQKHKDELNQWAKDNNIPQEYLPVGGPRGQGGHRGGHMGPGMMNQTSK